jgi:hypothetical protein
MSTAKKLNRISVEDYLAGELVSPINHEYLGGLVYAMAGARNLHSVYEGLDAALPVPEVGITLPLTDVYDGVEFSPEEPPEE